MSGSHDGGPLKGTSPVAFRPRRAKADKEREPLRVCFLAPELLPNRGGVGTYSVELLRRLGGQVDLTVLTPLRLDGAETFDRSRLESYFDHRFAVLPISTARDSFRYNLAFQRAVRRYLARELPRERFDLIHSQHAHMPDLLTNRAARRVPTVRTMHTTIDGQREGIRIARHLGGGLESSERWQVAVGPVLRAAERSVLRRRGDRYIAVSAWMRDQLLARGISPDRVRLIHCGGDPERFRPGARNGSAVRPSAQSRIVLFPGRPTLVKGASVVAQAIPRVLAQVPETEFAFTGGGAEDFLRLARLPPTAAARVRFLGNLPYDALPAVFASADLAIAPTYYEDFPIRILECLASGVPVVASDVGGIHEAVVPGETGALVPPGDPGSLSEAIVGLLRDDAARTRLGENGRKKVVDEFSWDRAAALTLALYRDVAGTAG
jgi:glycosyltransferase involved in cell wall biosynthesis